MIFWVIYFTAVTFLQVINMVSAHAFLNLGLFLFIFLPLPGAFFKKSLVIKIRKVLSFILAIVLFWHESYLPSVNILWNFFIDPELRPSANFIINFFLSLLNLKILAVASALLALGYAFAKTSWKKYFVYYFIACFFIIGLTEQQTTADNLLGNFYDDEAKRTVEFTDNKNNNFDIVVLQLCSFSWADFQVVNFDTKPFFNNFNYVFTNFNSATTYSNPAVIRLLRSTCGQASHEKLFTEADEKCYFMDSLRKIGYSAYTALNHNGVYSGFNEEIVKYGKAEKPLDNASLKAVETSFDNTPIYSDKEVLDLWLQARQANKNKKAVLFYNSITLHTGGHYGNNILPNNEGYSLALKNITNDLNAFFNEIAKTKKNTIVVVLGEHGAALAGSVLQPATVREIPLLDITKVPAAIKLIGPDFSEKENKVEVINSPASYLALVELLARIIKNSPENIAELAKLNLQRSLPESKIVAENGSGVVLQNNFGLFYNLKNRKNWDTLPASLMIKPINYLEK